MRLSDKSETPVPDGVRAELDAIDAALEGGSVPLGKEDLALLTHELRAMRPDEDADFAAALDAWAAAGFPRDTRPGLASPDPGGTGLGARLASLLRPRRLGPVAVAVTGAVVAVVAISQVGAFGGGDEPIPEAATTADEGGDAAATPGQSEGAAFDVGSGEQLDVLGGSREFRDTRLPGGYGSTALLQKSKTSAERRAVTPVGGLAFSNESAGSASADLNTAQGPARGQEARKVERDADLTLSTSADDVQEVTNEAIEVIRGHKGIVLLSQSTIGSESARATLQLAIPTKSLDAAIADLSGLADVKSLSEGSLDITKPFVSAKNRLTGLRAERQGVLAALKVADTEAEIDALKIRLSRIQSDFANAEAELDNLQQRARLSNVTLQITSDGADLNDDWSFEEALDDAGKVLTVAAGVALISAAVLIPLALIAAVAFLLAGWARNRSRERTLDE